jgi:hypothetical protein
VTLIPGPDFSHPGSRLQGPKGTGSRIRNKEFKYFHPKKLLLSSQKYDPGCSSRNRIQGSKKHWIPDSDQVPFQLTSRLHPEKPIFQRKRYPYFLSGFDLNVTRAAEVESWNIGKKVVLKAHLSEKPGFFHCTVLEQLLKMQLFTHEAESKEKHGVWDHAVVDYVLTSTYVHSRVDSNTFTMGNPMPESALTLCQSRLYPPVRDFGLGL